MTKSLVFSWMLAMSLFSGSGVAGSQTGNNLEFCVFDWTSALADCSYSLLNFTAFRQSSTPLTSGTTTAGTLFVSFSLGGLNQSFIQDQGCINTNISLGTAGLGALLVGAKVKGQAQCSGWQLPSGATLSTISGAVTLNFTGTTALLLTIATNSSLTDPSLRLLSVQNNLAQASLTAPFPLSSTPCYPSPCLQGSCSLNISYSSGFFCRCPTNYGGSLCQLSPCMDQPGRPAPNCSAHSRCVVDPRQAAGYGCACRRGYDKIDGVCQLVTSNVLFAFYGDYATVYPGHEQEFTSTLIALLASALSYPNNTFSVTAVTSAEENVVVTCLVPQDSIYQLNRDVQNKLLTLTLPFAAQPLHINPDSFCESTSTYNCTFVPVPTTAAPTSAPSSRRQATSTLVFVAVGVVGFLVIVMAVVIVLRRRRQHATYVRLRMLARSEDDSASIQSWENDT